MLDVKTGALRLQGVTLHADDAAEVLQQKLTRLGREAPQGNAEAISTRILPLSTCETAGGALSPVAYLQNGRLYAITLTVLRIGTKRHPSADAQRAFLFSLIHTADPTPDSKRPVTILADFGLLMLATDPRSGQTQLRIQYA